MKNKSKLFADLGEMLKTLTDKEKKALIKAAKAKEADAKAAYILGGHTGFMGGHWTGD